MTIKRIGKGLKSMLLVSLLALAFSLLLSAVSLALPDEAYGTVINVVDGDTFDVRMEKADPRVAERVERVRLADVDSPEMTSREGPSARDFTYALLQNKRVYLDIDDLTPDGRDGNGRLVCLAYLAGAYGQPLPFPNLNRLLVDSGYARLENSTDNEFDPGDWWEDDLIPSSDALVEMGRDLKRELLPQMEESAESVLDRAARELRLWLKGL